MRLGLDFGTTRTVVSYADRGNYPVVGFPDEYGDMRDFVPSVAAIHGGKLVFGFEALAAGRAGAAVLRSFKRLLADPGVTPATQVAIGDRSTGLLDLVSAFFAALHDEVTRRSTLVGLLDGDEPLEVVAGVPAHAYAAQRFLTIDALRRGGFRVAGLVNEPSAASFEYTHRQARAVTSKRNQILVYDLGGGTFDASLIRVEGTRHEVVSSLGVNRLGGDDFDAALLECALEEAGTAAEPVRWSALLDEAREAKERISPQSRRITLDLSDRLATVMVDDFYARATPGSSPSLSWSVCWRPRTPAGRPAPGSPASTSWAVGAASRLLRGTCASDSAGASTAPPIRARPPPSAWPSPPTPRPATRSPIGCHAGSACSASCATEPRCRSIR
jgi:molecular chaperone DnaK (HSP70)